MDEVDPADFYTGIVVDVYRPLRGSVPDPRTYAAFIDRWGEPALELVLLMPGKISLEVRPVIRNALDLTVTLLAQCGDPSGFKSRHQALMLAQADWLGKARTAPR